MKKLLILLALTFFSVQSFAGSCPDGSDPVKSVSADGTYFVYNCGGNDTSNKTNNSATSSKKSLTEIKKSMDDDGIFQLEGFHALNAPHAINPVSVSDFSIIGKTSIRFESNHGECGEEPNWSDCDNDRERTELKYEDESWKTEKWYRFYLYLPKDYNSIAPAKMSLIQWRSMEPSKMLLTFQHMHAGLIFQRNADAFAESDIVLKSNEDLLGNWTEIIFNTNWHPDPEKGFMKVWIDGKLKVDINATAHYKKGGKLNLRYGLYSSHMSNYKNTFNTNKMPQRIVFYDGVKAEKNCQKLLDLNTCENLVSQNIKEYKLFVHNSDDKELHLSSICKISSASFDTAITQDDYWNRCTFVRADEKFIEKLKKIEASDAFDGSYSFTLSRFNPSEGSIKLGFGQLEISDGKISVAKNSRSLKTSSTSYYDTFEGQIDKEGNISAVFNVNALVGEGSPVLVGFTGTIDSLQIKGKFDDNFEMIIKFNKKAKQIKTTKATKVATSDSDPTVSKIIEVIQGDRFIIDIAVPHELAGSNIKLFLRGIDAPDTIKSCTKEIELGTKVKDIVTEKLADATSIKLKNFKKTYKGVLAQVIVDGKDLGEELIAKGYASGESGYWKAYICSAVKAYSAGEQYLWADDLEKAIFWLERALVMDPDSNRSSGATYGLASAYKQQGIDVVKARDYLKKAATLGVMNAELELGKNYLNGWDGFKKDSSEGKYWLKKAHEHGSKDAEDICGCEF